MNSRDNDLVFVGMPITGSGKWATQTMWRMFESGRKIGKYSFITCQVGGMGLSMARNVITHLALKSGAGKCVQLDSDVVFGPGQVERILSHLQPFVGGMYPKKSLDLKWVGNLTGQPADDNGLAPAYDFGGGFCVSNLTAVENMIRAFPETAFESECDFELSSELNVKRREIIHDLWSTGPVRDVWNGRMYPRHLTEDFYYCWRAINSGHPLFMDTRCQVGHVGDVDFLQVWQMMQALEQTNAKLRAVVASLSGAPLQGHPGLKDLGSAED